MVDDLQRIFAENPVECLEDSPFGDGQNQRQYSSVNKSDECGRPCLTAVFNIRLIKSCLHYKCMNMECICKCYQSIEYNHVMSVSSKPEREQHECKYRNAVWRKRYRHISESNRLFTYFERQ